MSNLRAYELMFQERHGLLPEQAIDRIAELESERSKIFTRWRNAEAALERVRGLPEKWRNAYTIIRCAPETGIAGIKQPNMKATDCADELAAALKDSRG